MKFKMKEMKGKSAPNLAKGEGYFHIVLDEETQIYLRCFCGSINFVPTDKVKQNSDNTIEPIQNVTCSSCCNQFYTGDSKVIKSKKSKTSQKKKTSQKSKTSTKNKTSKKKKS